jgi:uncharacterized protein involved in type VI secretion and phage assembly
MSEVRGVVPAIVTNVDDPLHQGRIKVSFQWLDETHETDWIRIATMMAGGGRGTHFIPEVRDEVLIAFQQNDPRAPYVVGFLWNGQDAPPAEHVRDRAIVSRNGHMIRFLDSTPDGGNLGALIVQDAHGNYIVMTNGKISVHAVGLLEITAPTITLNGRVVAPNGNPI